MTCWSDNTTIYGVVNNRIAPITSHKASRIGFSDCGSSGLPCRLEAAQVAARAFVEIQPPTILIGVGGFSGYGLAVQRPTDNREDVLDTIDRLTPQGASSLGGGFGGGGGGIRRFLLLNEPTL